jgi:transcriptional regulator with XRE-family HTH domain
LPTRAIHVGRKHSVTLHLLGGFRDRLQRLRQLRRRQKVLSMRELEEMSNVSYNTIWRLENGHTGAQPRTIRKIAEALGVDPAELIR